MSGWLFGVGVAVLLGGLSLKESGSRLHDWMVGIGFLMAVAGFLEIVSFYEIAHS